MREGSGFFQHGHTYLGHPVACAAALAVQQVMARDRLVAQAATLGQHLERTMRAVWSDHRHIGDIRGRGLMWGIELVADRAAKAPFDPALRLHARIKQQAMQRGLMVYPMGGTVDGRQGDHVLIAPPFIASTAQLDEVVQRLDAAITAAIDSL
jgi:adenosylmethionine-8-amino-7-oxononanoate aminotransferase